MQFWPSPAIAKLCNIERFLPVYNTLTLFPNDLVKYKFEIADAENKLTDLKAQLNQNSFSMGLTMEARSDTDDFQNDFDSGELTSSLSLNIPLNLKKTKLENQLKEQRLELGRLELQSLKRQQTIEKLSLIIDYAEAIELHNILKSRLSNNQVLMSYYSELRNSGNPDFDSELEVKATITRIKDKIFANKIRLSNIEQSLGAVGKQIPPFKINNVSMEPLNMETCSLIDLRLITAKLELNIHEIEEKLLDLEARASLSSSLTLSNTQENNGSNSDAARAQLTLSIPLYDGGKTSDDRAFKLQQQSIRKREILEFTKSQASDLTLQFSKEQVFESSLVGVQEEIKNFEARIEEFNERQELGQTSFPEFSKTKDEKLKLNESRLRIKKEFLKSWFIFLNDKFEKEAS